MKGSEDLKKGLWTAEEDRLLMEHVKVHGKGKWNRVAKVTGLKRCGKSCRLRWMNYLRPEIKLGAFSDEEDELIIRLHRLLGNRWSLIAGRVPGRTDNQVKNHWNTHLKKKVLCAKSSKESAVAGSIKVRDRMSVNSSIETLNKEGSKNVQEMSSGCQKMEEQKTMSVQEGKAFNGDELFESLSWLWRSNEPWDLLEHDSWASKQNKVNV